MVRPVAWRGSDRTLMCILDLGSIRTCTHRQRISNRIMSYFFSVPVIDETSKHMSSKEGEGDFVELYCTVSVPPFRHLQGVTKSSGLLG